MILQGFEIENWSCIKKLKVENLPSSGVIVLHGPNRTGKSSIVRALRACLMDYPSTSSALKSVYPRGSGEKPLVGVTFASGGKTYRIRKWFGSSKSEFALQTSRDAWKVETTSAAEAHSRMCELAGGDDSSKGLRQLLWLTQAEFRLPEAKKFDAGVQAQLRGILGVLQTPLDDAFIARVKARWETWYAGQRKAEKSPSLKPKSNLALKLGELANVQSNLDTSEQKFQEIEGLIRQAGNLEGDKSRLARELEQAERQWKALQTEQQQSQARISQRKTAEGRHTAALKEQAEAAAESQQRAAAVESLAKAEGGLSPAQQAVTDAITIEQELAKTQGQLREDRTKVGNQRRQLQQRTKRLAAKLRSFDDEERLKTATALLADAQEIVQEIAAIDQYLAAHPAPSKTQLDALSQNRQRVVQLLAARDAASMTLKLVPAADATPAQITIDASPQASSSHAATFAVRHRAEISIAQWGTIELSRGANVSDIDQIENDLQRLEEEFASGAAPFGVSTANSAAIDQLLKLAADQREKKSARQTQEAQLKKLAPTGLDPLARNVRELETRLAAAVPTELTTDDPLPTERLELEMLQGLIQKQVEALEDRDSQLEREQAVAQEKLIAASAQVTRFKELAAGCEATARGRREVLAKLRSEEQIAERIAVAARELDQATESLAGSALTLEETTINERVSVSEESVRALSRQIADTNEKYNRIRGRLEGVEGLHKERAELGAKAELLRQVTTAEALEKDAVDRLYELFEECRDKQLGTLMAPVEQRVLGWMQALDLGKYRELRFTDAFLPDQLIRTDGTAEFHLDEESTGAQEQIGMLVRLALGSLLTSPAEPALAILDDPLTHCDAARLANMRRILRRAAEGDVDRSPPAGPLQILVLTCHPEWFRDEQATVIDLDNPAVLERFPV